MLEIVNTPEVIARRIAVAISGAIADVMAERGLDATRIAPEATLSDTLGLTSMDLAQIVLNLEDELEIDPFQTIPITSIRTVGDLIGAYAASLGVAGATAPGGQDMEAEMAAAKARRTGRRRS
jgi:acyl carrier protein